MNPKAAYLLGKEFVIELALLLVWVLALSVTIYTLFMGYIILIRGFDG